MNDVIRDHKRAEHLMRWKVEIASAENPKDRKKRITDTCSKCTHWDGVLCRYALDVGHQRPCPGVLCREMGVFERRRKKKP